MINAYKKLLFFLSPFIVLTLFVFLIDPYNFYNVSHIIKDSVKLKCINRSHAVSPRGNILWKTIAFKRNSTRNILLGDSKSLIINSSKLGKELGGRATNLSIPGANYQTIIDLFWMANEHAKLKNVMIQVSFLQYNKTFHKVDLYSPVKQLFNHPIKYFLNWTYLKDSFFILYYVLIGNDHLVDPDYHLPGTPWSRSKEWILSELTQKKYIYPEDFYNRLKDISEYCNKNNINLCFVITPTYYELQNIIDSVQVRDRYMRFKNDIKSIGTTIDLDTGIPISKRKENFYDYMHLKPELGDSLLMMIFHNVRSENIKY